MFEKKTLRRGENTEVARGSVIYSIFVLDLKLVKWERDKTAQTASHVLPAAVLQAAEYMKIF